MESEGFFRQDVSNYQLNNEIIIYTRNIMESRSKGIELCII